MKAILSILLASTLLCSCHSDLDVIQKSEISAKSMWQDEEDATSAMYGMFNKFRSTFSAGYAYWGEYRTGLWGDGLAGQSDRTQVYQSQIQPITVMRIGPTYIQPSIALTYYQSTPPTSLLIVNRKKTSF